MKPWQAALIPIGLLVLLWMGRLALVAAHVDSSIPGMTIQSVFFIGSSIWAWFEAKRLQMHKYEDMSGPVFILFGSLFLWIIVFPAFMHDRQKILNGTATLRMQFLDEKNG